MASAKTAVYKTAARAIDIDADECGLVRYARRVSAAATTSTRAYPTARLYGARRARGITLSSNFARVQNMTARELAEWLAPFTPCKICAYRFAECEGLSCADGIEKWLHYEPQKEKER